MSPEHTHGPEGHITRQPVSPTPVGQYVIDSLRSQAQTDIYKSLASLKLLLDHAVGIGDHSTDDYHKNVAQALDQLVDAEDRIAILDKWFPTNQRAADIRRLAAQMLTDPVT